MRRDKMSRKPDCDFFPRKKKQKKTTKKSTFKWDSNPTIVIIQALHRVAVILFIFFFLGEGRSSISIFIKNQYSYKVYT